MYTAAGNESDETERDEPALSARIGDTLPRALRVPVEREEPAYAADGEQEGGDVNPCAGLAHRPRASRR